MKINDPKRAESGKKVTIQTKNVINLNTGAGAIIHLTTQPINDKTVA